MKNTICAHGGRVHIEPVAGGHAVLLSVQSDAGEVASILIDESSGGAVMFAIDNSLELAAIQRVAPVTARQAEAAAVRSIAP